MSNEQPIGVIDSGVGGLTVVKELMKQLPNESIIYLGDTARCPYGPRPAEQVVEFTWQMARFLLKHNIKMLVIACNTATAVALEEIKEQLAIPVVGVILPGSRAAVKASRTGKIGMIGTLGTVKSKSYDRALHEKNPSVEMISLACPKFVPIVESNQAHTSVAKKIVAQTLQPLHRNRIDTLILGCTHYPLLRPIIQNVMGEGVQLIDSGAETVTEVSMLLDYFQLANLSHKKKREMTYFTTGSAVLFDEIANQWLESADPRSQQMTLGGE